MRISGIEVLTEENDDEGNIGVYIDGALDETVSADDPTQRLAQQAVVSISGLSPGTHTIKLVKATGTYLLLDALVVIPTAITPVHNITFSGITFEYTTWNTPTTAGYFDNQSGVLWDPSTDTPVKTPAAVQVHRGDDIDFTDDVIQHTGDTGIDLADGTQNSAITGNWITDTSASGVDVGEVDDYYQNLTALMTLDDTISENTITHVGLDYHDDVGVWAGYTRGMVISNNDIGYSPYGGISVGWGWGWQSPCSMQSAQGLSTCRHGTDYAGDNQILDNDINNITVDDNYSDNASEYDNGTDTTFTQATIVSDGAWPAAAQAIIAAAGPSEQYKPVTGLIDDDDLGISYTGDWYGALLRGLGDLDDGVHATTANGASASYTFTGTGISVISEKYSDEGSMEVYLDGVDEGAYSAYSATREAQQVLYSVSGLTVGRHTLTLTKESGTYMLVDRFDVS